MKNLLEVESNLFIFIGCGLDLPNLYIISTFRFFYEHPGKVNDGIDTYNTKHLHIFGC